MVALWEAGVGEVPQACAVESHSFRRLAGSNARLPVSTAYSHFQRD
jgi:hypothetical protein